MVYYTCKCRKTWKMYGKYKMQCSVSFALGEKWSETCIMKVWNEICNKKIWNKMIFICNCRKKVKDVWKIQNAVQCNFCTGGKVKWNMYQENMKWNMYQENMKWNMYLEKMKWNDIHICKSRKKWKIYGIYKMQCKFCTVGKSKVKLVSRNYEMKTMKCSAV